MIRLARATTVMMILSSTALAAETTRQELIEGVHDGASVPMVRSPAWYIASYEQARLPAPKADTNLKSLDSSLRAAITRTVQRQEPVISVVGSIGAPPSEPTAPESTPVVFQQAECPKTRVAINLLFPLNSSEVRQDEYAQLLSSLMELKKEGDLEVSVRGFTCDLGTQERNDTLAVERAEAVASKLRSSGFHITEVSGVGRAEYLTFPPDRRELNRRASIEVKIERKDR